jgi:hypothetical protein
MLMGRRYYFVDSLLTKGRFKTFEAACEEAERMLREIAANTNEKLSGIALGRGHLVDAGFEARNIWRPAPAPWADRIPIVPTSRLHIVSRRRLQPLSLRSVAERRRRSGSRS